MLTKPHQATSGRLAQVVQRQHANLGDAFEASVVGQKRLTTAYQRSRDLQGVRRAQVIPRPQLSSTLGDLNIDGNQEKKRRLGE